MTVQLKTLKTADIDMQGGSEQEFFKTIYSEEPDSVDARSDTRTPVTG